MLILLSIKKILNGECLYLAEDGTTQKANSTYLSELKGDSAKQQCFSLSNYNGKNDGDQDICCYDSANNKCITKDSLSDNCPKKADIANNCGMAGIYEPITSEICTSISLVQGYCCFVKIKSYGTACVRTKKLNEDKNTTTDQITNYVRAIKEGAEIESVICKETYLKYFWSLFFFVFIFLL